MRLAVLLATLALSAAATANAAAQDPRQICLERYNVEKSGGTIPVGMSKATYVRQCTGSIRRAALQQQEQPAQSAVEEAIAGANEVTVAPRPAKPAPTINKPVRIKTPTAVGTGQ